MRSFSLLARLRSRSSELISARSESRSVFFSASGSTGLSPRSSAVVGSGAGGAASWVFLAGRLNAGGAPFWGTSEGRIGGCLSGEELLIFSANALLRLGRFEGVLCMPDGGVLTTGSGCSGVGGSSGSGTTTSGSTPRDRGGPRPGTAFNISPSSSGPGGGSGRGIGLFPAASAGSRLGGDRKTLLSSDAACTPPWRAPERSSSWVLNARVRPPVLSGVTARAAEGGASGEDRSLLGSLSRRLRISGLNLSRVARVGDANEGRLGRLATAPGRGGASRGVVDSSSGWMAIAVRGDVRRLFGAGSSMVAQLSF